ncbi:MAG: N-acetyltransferase [Hyphomicrobiales bacterium]|nr:N-acetyltransferase [Hyphomicrobiales bacterium]
MNTSELIITPELCCHDDAVEALAAKAFGPGRFARTAFRLREGVAHEDSLSFVALRDNLLVGSVRVTRIMIGDRTALVLGPLVVSPSFKNDGIGTKLMTESVKAAKNQDHELVILVGDEPYYRPFGFKRVPAGQIILPGPVDPARILYCELQEGSGKLFCGSARAYS